VVEVVANSSHVLSPIEVFDMGRSLYPKLGLVTVYRTIEKLEELHLLERVHQPSGCQGFIASSDGHYHLLICQNCGLVKYFSGDSDNIDYLMTDVEQQSGYKIREHWLQLFGVCEACQAQNQN
jgi:Fe2+ or Zn2+ uptake regulation protein